MKLTSLIPVLCVSALLAACDSLSNPFANWFHGNHDQRVYNPQTGQWEYPNATPAPNRSGAVANAMGSQQQSSDGRYFDPQKNQWVELHSAGSPAQSAPGTEPAAAPAASAPLSTPAPPRPPRDTGVYNPATGKIEWQSSGGTAPSYASTASAAAASKPKKAKHWWWPF